MDFFFSSFNYFIFYYHKFVYMFLFYLKYCNNNVIINNVIWKKKKKFWNKKYNFLKIFKKIKKINEKSFYKNNNSIL